jgi:hypothetical protein
VSGRVVTGRADRWIKWTTTGCVALLALIAGTVSYLHMHELVAMHGQPGWVAALTPLSVDGMIVAASTTLLAESRSGSRGGVLPWTLLAVGSVASLAANVAVAQPTICGRLTAAWPSFALICSYELLMRQVRCAAPALKPAENLARPTEAMPSKPAAHRASVSKSAGRRGSFRSSSLNLQREAWRWAQNRQVTDGSLPSGREIAQQFGRHERWGRLVKRVGLAGELAVSERRETAAEIERTD